MGNIREYVMKVLELTMANVRHIKLQPLQIGKSLSQQFRHDCFYEWTGIVRNFDGKVFEIRCFDKGEYIRVIFGSDFERKTMSHLQWTFIVGVKRALNGESG